MRRMSGELGEKTRIEEQTFHAFPGPQTLMAFTSHKGLSELKIERLHGVARAALEGLLDREGLLALPSTDSLAKLRNIPGIGPFFAQGILHRGAGLVDDITNDDLTRFAAQIAYKLNKPPELTTLLEIAEPWRPFRMWAVILLHIWVRREIGVPKKRTFAVSR